MSIYNFTINDLITNMHATECNIQMYYIIYLLSYLSLEGYPAWQHKGTSMLTKEPQQQQR